MEKDKQARAAYIGRIAPTPERISSFAQLADLIRDMNTHSLDHWMLNDTLFFGDVKGTYVTALLYTCVLEPQTNQFNNIKGFVEIADDQLLGALKKMFAFSRKFYFGFGREDQYTFDLDALWSELEEEAENE